MLHPITPPVLDRKKDWKNKLLKPTPSSPKGKHQLVLSNHETNTTAHFNTSAMTPTTPTSIASASFTSWGNPSKPSSSSVAPNFVTTPSSSSSSSSHSLNNHAYYSTAESSPDSRLTGLNTPPSFTAKQSSTASKLGFPFRSTKRALSFSSSKSQSYSHSNDDLLTNLEPCDEPFFTPLSDDLTSRHTPSSQGYFRSLSHHDLSTNTPKPIVPKRPRISPSFSLPTYVPQVHEQPPSLNLPKTRGPKIQPFISTQTKQPKRSFSDPIGSRKCFICEELLQTKLEQESVVSLKCGDYLHGTCFNIIVNSTLEAITESGSDLADNEDLKLVVQNALPPCEGIKCWDSRQHRYSAQPEPFRRGQISPKDDMLIPGLISKFASQMRSQDTDANNANSSMLLGASNLSDALKSNSSPFTKQSTERSAQNPSGVKPIWSSHADLFQLSSVNSNTDNSASSSSQLGDPFTLTQDTELPHQRSEQPSFEKFPLPEFSTYDMTHSNKSQSSPTPLASSFPLKNSFAPARSDSTACSFLSARCPSPCPTISTMNTVSVKIEKYKQVPLDRLKDHFVKYLVDNCSKITLTTLLSLGPLRLVDQLLVSSDDAISFHSRVCYLFTHFLVIWSPNEGYDAEASFFPMSSQDTTVQTPEPSTLKITSSCSSQHIYLNSDTNSIIEKWGVAICDSHFLFPPELFTSTILLPQFRDTDCSFPNASAGIDSVKNGLDEFEYDRGAESSSIHSAQESEVTVDITIDKSNEQNTTLNSNHDERADVTLQVPQAELCSDHCSDTESERHNTSLEIEKIGSASTTSSDSEDSDFDSDGEEIANLIGNFNLAVNVKNIDKIFTDKSDIKSDIRTAEHAVSRPQAEATKDIEEESDESDTDSDDEMINEALKTLDCREDGWSNLQEYVDRVLINGL